MTRRNLPPTPPRKLPAAAEVNYPYRRVNAVLKDDYDFMNEIGEQISLMENFFERQIEELRMQNLELQKINAELNTQNEILKIKNAALEERSLSDQDRVEVETQMENQYGVYIQQLQDELKELRESMERKRVRFENMKAERDAARKLTSQPFVANALDEEQMAMIAKIKAVAEEKGLEVKNLIDSLPQIFVESDRKSQQISQLEDLIAQLRSELKDTKSKEEISARKAVLLTQQISESKVNLQKAQSLIQDQQAEIKRRLTQFEIEMSEIHAQRVLIAQKSEEGKDMQQKIQDLQTQIAILTKVSEITKVISDYVEGKSDAENMQQAFKGIRQGSEREINQITGAFEGYLLALTSENGVRIDPADFNEYFRGPTGQIFSLNTNLKEFFSGKANAELLQRNPLEYARNMMQNLRDAKELVDFNREFGEILFSSNRPFDKKQQIVGLARGFVAKMGNPLEQGRRPAAAAHYPSGAAAASSVHESSRWQ